MEGRSRMRSGTCFYMAPIETSQRQRAEEEDV